MDLRRWRRLQIRLLREIRHLLVVNASDRRWQLPMCAALAIGLPLLAGAFFDRLHESLVASLGGLVFLYAPSTDLRHRMSFIAICACGMTICYTLGLFIHLQPTLLVPVLTLLTIVVTLSCRYFQMGPPANLFFVMAAAIGAYTPVSPDEILWFVALQVMGNLLAILIALLYGLYAVRQNLIKPPERMAVDFSTTVFDSIVIGLFVGLSLVLAQTLQLERAYWVPVSCLAVIHGASLRAVWTRQAHRIGGTCLGLMLTWGLMRYIPNVWVIPIMMMTLVFLIEFLVVRHYGIAVVFITPLTILLAEASYIGQGASHEILQARLFDTILGSAVGLLGGICLHSKRLREALL